MSESGGPPYFSILIRSELLFSASRAKRCKKKTSWHAGLKMYIFPKCFSPLLCCPLSPVCQGLCCCYTRCLFGYTAVSLGLSIHFPLVRRGNERRVNSSAAPVLITRSRRLLCSVGFNLHHSVGLRRVSSGLLIKSWELMTAFILHLASRLAFLPRRYPQAFAAAGVVVSA